METRAELYKALHRSPMVPSEEEEEEGAAALNEDISLKEHLKLKESMLNGSGAMDKPLDEMT